MTSRFKIAEERLEKALGRVDEAITRGGAENPNVSALEAQNADLRNHQRELANRLDTAIAKLKLILEE